MDRKLVFSTEHICELCSKIGGTMLPVVTNPLVGLDPVLRDIKVEFNGYFHGYKESFQDHNAGATMGTHCYSTRGSEGGGNFRGKTSMVERTWNWLLG